MVNIQNKKLITSRVEEFKFKKTEFHNFEIIVKLFTGGGGLRQPNPNINIGS